MRDAAYGGEENGGTGILSTLTEEEGQIGKGVNGDVPAPDYSYYEIGRASCRERV